MEDSTQEVVKGSQLADDAGRSLNSIYGAVERQAKMIEDIARAANEQTSVSEAVAVTMSRISEITRQTDAGTQEAAVSVSYLAELSEQLRASVSTFHLPERTNDVLGSFSSDRTSAPEMPDSRNNQNYTPVLSSGADMSWSGFGNNFPALPEPSNLPSLVPMNSQSNPGPFSGGGQQDFGSFGGNGQQQDFGSFGGGNGQQDFGRMASFTSNTGFPGQNANQNNPSNLPGFSSNTGMLGQNANQNNPSNFPSFASNAGALGPILDRVISPTYQPLTPLVVLLIVSSFLVVSKTLLIWIISLVLIQVFLTDHLAQVPAFGSGAQGNQPLPNPGVPKWGTSATVWSATKCHVSAGKVFHQKTRISNCLVGIRSGALVNP